MNRRELLKGIATCLLPPGLLRRLRPRRWHPVVIRRNCVPSIEPLVFEFWIWARDRQEVEERLERRHEDILEDLGAFPGGVFSLDIMIGSPGRTGLEPGLWLVYIRDVCVRRRSIIESEKSDWRERGGPEIRRQHCFYSRFTVEGAREHLLNSS